MTSKDVIAFLAWAEDNGITWDKSAVEIKEGKLGFGLYAKRHLEAEYEVVKVPKAIILSVETTGIANLLADEEIEGYTGLIMGCLYELSRGSASPWSTYLEFLLKHPAQMATSIPKDTREMLKNCEVYNDIESDIKDLQDDYDSIVVPFVEKHPEVFPKEIKAEFFSFDAYKAMAGHVSSRGMDVDHFHIMALVPFADFPMPNADFLTHEDVCEICGNLVCEHREHDDDDSEDGSTDTEGDDDDEDDTKVPDLVGADGATPSKKDTDDEEEEWEDEDQEDDEDEDEDEDEEDIDDTCDIILDTDVKKGQEITRHYGPYPNKILLSKYGFAVEDNPHDTVTIQLEMIRQAAQKFIKDEESVEERIQWFLENEDAFIGAEDGHAHGDGCCDGGDHEHGDACQQGSEDEAHDHHKHAKDGACCSNNKQKKARPHGTKEDKSDEEMEENDADDDNGDKDDSDTDDDDDDDFPRDIMYILNDGCVDDRLLMLLNVLFMEKDMFAKAKDDTDGAMEYFDEVFLRRQHEEMEEDMDEDVELKSRDAKSKKVRKAVLKAILELVRIRADAFGVSNKTTAEQDLTKLKKAKLQGTLFYGGLCVQGEKQILQRALQGSNRLLSEL
ncbi:hypothetical protein BGX31_002191 [Mortierella sp. GBA43]|nr:hypothetical protein BGX31_002191 [Mortierella sp. GBA43]